MRWLCCWDLGVVRVLTLWVSCEPGACRYVFPHPTTSTLVLRFPNPTLYCLFSPVSKPFNSLRVFLLRTESSRQRTPCYVPPCLIGGRQILLRCPADITSYLLELEARKHLLLHLLRPRSRAFLLLQWILLPRRSACQSASSRTRTTRISLILAQRSPRGSFLRSSG